jgi:hypothetical protein
MASKRTKFVQINKDTYNSMKFVDVFGEVEMYRIKDTKSGLYSSGGMVPKFTRYGKVWKRRSDIVSHLRSFAETTGPVPATWQVEVVRATVTDRTNFIARDVAIKGMTEI